MVPFRLVFHAGQPLYEQVVFAAQRAIVSGQLRAGDPFPSVRALSREFKINPNTAHKVVAHLVQEKLLEVRPGQGTFVVALPRSTGAEKARLLNGDVERLVVEARRLGLSVEDIQKAVDEQWRRLDAAGRQG